MCVCRLLFPLAKIESQDWCSKIIQQFQGVYPGWWKCSLIKRFTRKLELVTFRLLMYFGFLDLIFMRFNTGRTRKSQFHPKSYIYSFMKNFRRISRGPIVQRIPWYFFLSFPAAENAENGWFPNHFRLSRSSLWHHRMTWRSFFRGWNSVILIYWLIRHGASCKKGFKNGCLGYRFWGWNSKNQVL